MNTYTKTLLNGIKAYVKKNTANDWDAEEGESGFISNKPFYDHSTVETITLFDITFDNPSTDFEREVRFSGYNDYGDYDTQEVYNRLTENLFSSEPPEEIKVTVNGTSFILPFQGSSNGGANYGALTDSSNDSRFELSAWLGTLDSDYHFWFGIADNTQITWNSIKLEVETVVENIKQIDKKFIPIQDTVKPIITIYDQANEQLQWNREYQLLIEGDTEFSLADPQGTYPEEINLYLWSTGNYNISFNSNDPIFIDNNLSTPFSSMAVTQGVYEISLKQICVSGNWVILCAMRTPSALPSGA